MLRTLSSGEGTVTAPGAARSVSVASVMCACDQFAARHARACPEHPGLLSLNASKTWMAGTGPAMTPLVSELPPKPFRLARQFDGLDLLELDGALGHQIVEVAVRRP